MAKVSTSSGSLLKNTLAGAAGAVASTGKNTGKSSSSGSTSTKTNTTGSTVKAGDEAILSAADKATINRLTEQWNAATAAGNSALADSIHQQAEAIRSNYGYSGGADGSGIYAIAQGKPQMQMPQYEVESLESYLKDMYAAQAEAAEAQLKAAYDRNVGALDEAQKNIPQIYRNARNQTAAESAVAGANFNEYAAAQGLGSGSATQAQLARTNALQGGLTAIDQQQANALADIEAERAQLMQQYQTAITEAKSQNKAALADALYSEMLRLQQEYQDYADKQMQWQYQLQQDQYARQLNEAKLAAQYGDLSRLGSMGIISSGRTGSIYDSGGDDPNPTPYNPSGNTPAANNSKVQLFTQLYGGLSDAAKIEMLNNARFTEGTLTSSEYNAIMDAWGF